MSPPTDTKTCATGQWQAHGASTMFAARRLPLCRRYPAAFIGQQPVSWRQSDVLKEGVMYWCAGLADEGIEPWGCWPTERGEGVPWTEIQNELATRGLESVGLFLGAEVTEACNPSSLSFQDVCAHVPAPRGLLRKLGAGEGVAASFNRVLANQLKKQGVFDSRRSAVVVFEAALLVARRGVVASAGLDAPKARVRRYASTRTNTQAANA